MKGESAVPAGYEMPDGWRQDMPKVFVSRQVIESLGLPTVNYDGVASLFTEELGLSPTHLPATEFRRILMDDPAQGAFNVHYSRLFHSIDIDPVTTAELQSPSEHIVRLMAWGGVIARELGEHPVRTLLPAHRKAVMAAALAAKSLPNLVENYGGIVQFPLEKPSRSGIVVPRQRQRTSAFTPSLLAHPALG